MHKFSSNPSSLVLRYDNIPPSKRTEVLLIAKENLWFATNYNSSLSLKKKSWYKYYSSFISEMIHKPILYVFMKYEKLI